MPKVSICIPTYNRKSYLKETLNSVFCQTYDDFEIVIVDDGSTDGTDKMVAAMDESIRYFKQENSGDAAARNTLIKMATGKYITFIDSDDLLYPDSVERLYDAIKNDNGKSIAYGGYLRIDKSGTALPTKQKKLPSGNITIPLFQQIIVHTCGSMFPKQALVESGGFDSSLRVCSDYDVWLKLSTLYRFVALDKPTFKRRRHGDNLSALSFENLLTEYHVLEKFYYHRGGCEFVPESIALPRLAKENYRVSMAALKAGKSLKLVHQYLNRAVKLNFTFKASIKLYLITFKMFMSRS